MEESLQEHLAELERSKEKTAEPKATPVKHNNFNLIYKSLSAPFLRMVP